MCNKKVYKIYIMLLLYLKLKVKAFTLISSVFLDRVKEAFKKDAQLKSLLMDDYFCKKLAESHSSWRRAITTAINYGVPVLQLLHITTDIDVHVYLQIYYRF